jgi:thiol-disulfide isomerase/thioredoxin
MKKEFLIFVLVLFLSSGCRTNKPVTDSMTVTSQNEDIKPATNFSDQSTWLLGYFAKDQLTRPPYSEWFLKGYDDYQFNTDAVNKLAGISKNDITIKIVLGTWCPDSRREVPRFMHVLDLWQFPADKVTFIGVDNAKLSPVGEYEKLDIQRVPTFIFYRNNIESGRIIENPVTSLEQDMVNILNRNE